MQGALLLHKLGNITVEFFPLP